MEYHIVPMEFRHMEQITQLEQAYFSTPWTETMLKELLSDPHAVFLVAESEAGKVLGYASLQVVLDEGYIDTIAVTQEAQRQGVGGALLEVLCRYGEKHLDFLTLEVRESNQPARALYGKFEFQEVGRREGYYKAPKEDAILMTRFFRTPSKDGAI